METAYDEVSTWSSPTNDIIIMPPAWVRFQGPTERYYHIKRVLGDFFRNIYAHTDNEILLPLKEESFYNIALVLSANYKFYTSGPQHTSAVLEKDLERIARAHIRINLLHRGGRRVQERYKRAGGLQLLAQHYFRGDTEKTYSLVQDSLKSKLFKKLEWPDPKEIIMLPSEVQVQHLAYTNERRFRTRNHLWSHFFRAQKREMPREFDIRRTMSLEEMAEFVRIKPSHGETPYFIYVLQEIEEGAHFDEPWLEHEKVATLIKNFSGNIEHDYPPKYTLEIYKRVIKILIVLAPYEVSNMVEKLEYYINETPPSEILTGTVSNFNAEDIQGWILGKVFFLLNDTAQFAQRANESNKTALSKTVWEMRHEEGIVLFMAEVARQGIKLEAWTTLMREMYRYDWPLSMRRYIRELEQDISIPEEYRTIARIVVTQQGS